MAPTHDPLTEEHLAFLNSLPVELTVQEQGQGRTGQMITFLQTAGFISPQLAHAHVDPGQTVFRYIRTAKPLPGAE